LTVAIIIVIAILLVFVAVVSLRGLRRTRAEQEDERAEARVTAGKSEAQHERSLQRRADVRAAYAERASEDDRDHDEGRP
jgi:flagellar biosynthesis/type III secretory pathway M-ring protein FliF/YscJ